MLREQQGTTAAHVRVWAEEGCTNPAAPEAAEPLHPALLRLPIWTDAVLQSVDEQQFPASNGTTVGSSAGIQLPQSISWQRIPEAMRVTALRLVFEGQAAADIQQGMVCGLTITILGPDQAMAGGHQQDEIRKLEIAPASLVIQDHTTLSVKLDLPVGVDERVSLTAVGSNWGPGDAVYLASWGGQSTSQSFADDAMDTAYVLSHGDAAAGDACLVQVLLHQAEDAGNTVGAMITERWLCCVQGQSSHVHVAGCDAPFCWESAFCIFQSMFMTAESRLQAAATMSSCLMLCSTCCSLVATFPEATLTTVMTSCR